MCISATVLAIASLATAAAGTVVSISAASANARAQQDMLDLQRKQMLEQRQMEALQAQEAAVQRAEDYRRQRAANLAALAASGVGENMSFLQGIAPAEEKALRTDLANIRLGFLGGQNRMADEIRVNRLNRDIVGMNKTASIAGSLINFAGSAAQIGNFYQTYNTPKATPRGTATTGGNPGDIVVTRGN
ncbi:MAG: hypothetical protein LW689_06935 [Novosphingobium sp.]|nr:hypothetical protein [Novosphingobium sp.]